LSAVGPLAGALDGPPLEPPFRERISRRSRVRELADVLQGVA
jgi:hypothetical protein